MKAAVGNQFGQPLQIEDIEIDPPARGEIIKLYQSDELKLDELISGSYRLSEINAAIASMEKGDAIRNIIMFE